MLKFVIKNAKNIYILEGEEKNINKYSCAFAYVFILEVFLFCKKNLIFDIILLTIS